MSVRSSCCHGHGHRLIKTPQTHMMSDNNLPLQRCDKYLRTSKRAQTHTHFVDFFSCKSLTTYTPHACERIVKHTHTRNHMRFTKVRLSNRLQLCGPHIQPAILIVESLECAWRLRPVPSLAELRMRGIFVIISVVVTDTRARSAVQRWALHARRIPCASSPRTRTHLWSSYHKYLACLSQTKIVNSPVHPSAAAIQPTRTVRFAQFRTAAARDDPGDERTRARARSAPL